MKLNRRQKLQVELKNPPRNASQVPCSGRVVLNRGVRRRLGVQPKVLACNNLDGNQPTRKSRGFNNVFVLNVEGKPLMPTKSVIARLLLKQNKAKVVKRKPFTIQLLYKTTNFTQPITLGVDPGYKNVGFSAVTEKKELICGEVELDNWMSKRLQTKAMYRRGRRNRLWYRKPRFNNRTRNKGWLPPSVQRRLDTHVRLVEKLKDILPITKIVVETANFDIQKIKNPDIEGKGYQRGDLYGYKNLVSYLIARERGKCQFCSKVKGTGKWRTHHIISRNDGGTDKSDNQALIHEKCHDKLHKNNLGHLLKKNKQYKGATFMNIIKQRLLDSLSKLCPVSVTFGHITHQKILEQNLQKTHANDAFCIAKGNGQERAPIFKVIQKRKNNRVLQLNRKSGRRIRRGRPLIRPLDLVKLCGKIYVSGGGNYQVYLKDPKTDKVFTKVRHKLDNWIYHTKTLAWQ